MSLVSNAGISSVSSNTVPYCIEYGAYLKTINIISKNICPPALQSPFSAPRYQSAEYTTPTLVRSTRETSPVGPAALPGRQLVGGARASLTSVVSLKDLSGARNLSQCERDWRGVRVWVSAVSVLCDKGCASKHECECAEHLPIHYERSTVTGARTDYVSI